MSSRIYPKTSKVQKMCQDIKIPKIETTIKKNTTTSMTYLPKFYNVSGHGITLSYVGNGFTFKQMVNFYVRDSPWIKPGDILYIGDKKNINNSKSFVIINRQKKQLDIKTTQFRCPLPINLNYRKI